jgi:predicted nucleic acid-binding protein
VTVLDTSAAVDYLVGAGVAKQVTDILTSEGEVAAPDLIVFEVLAALRRETLRGSLAQDRADGALEDLADLPVELFPCLPLRRRAWELRDNLTAADALFVALAEQLDEPLVTKDSALAAAVRTHTALTVTLLSAAPSTS